MQKRKKCGKNVFEHTILAFSNKKKNSVALGNTWRTHCNWSKRIPSTKRVLKGLYAINVWELLASH